MTLKKAKFLINGSTISAEIEDIRLIEPMTEFDPLPQRQKKDYLIKGIETISLTLNNNKLKITW